MSMAIANLLNAEPVPLAHPAPHPPDDRLPLLTSPLLFSPVDTSPARPPASQLNDVPTERLPTGDEMLSAPHSSRAAAPASVSGAYARAERGRKLKMSEQMRRQAFAADEHVLVLNPHSVRCLHCTAELKLSRKSTYDLAHWTKHRERCIGKTTQKKGRRLSKAKTPGSPEARSPTPESTPSLVHSASESSTSTTPEIAERVLGVAGGAGVDGDDSRQEDDTYFSLRAGCADVTPPRVRASDPDFADAPIRFQLRIAYALQLAPARASEWDYSHLRRGPWPWSPSPGADYMDGAASPPFSTINRDRLTPSTAAPRFCPH